MKIKSIVLFVTCLFFSLSLIAEPIVTSEITKEEMLIKEKAIAEAKVREKQKQNQINLLLNKLKKIDLTLKDNILLKRYSNYSTYRKISSELEDLEKKYKIIKRKRGEKYKEDRYQLKNKIRIKNNELELISEYEDSPIGSLISPPEVEQYAIITNPFGIINALSFNKKLQNQNKTFRNLSKDVSYLTGLLEEEMFIYLELYNLEQKDEYEDQINY